MSQRINWSADGTLAYLINTGTGGRSALTSTQMQTIDSQPVSSSDRVLLTPDYKGVAFNFPSSIQVDQIGYLFASTRTFSVQVSSNSTDGLDGSWTTVLNAASYSTAGYLQYFEPTPTSCTWLRFENTVNFSDYLDEFHIFGAYDAPLIEFWDAGETAAFTDKYPLVFPSVSNHQEFTGTATFKVKNTDGATHSYSVAVAAVTYGGDAVVTDHISVSPTTITDLAADAFSSTITVTANYPVDHNPADGYHYFKIDVAETA